MSLHLAVNSHISTLENDVYVWCYALIVMHARIPEVSEQYFTSPPTQ